MDRETLESLMLDRALGGLSPEVAALLDAYLATSPEARAQAAAFEQVAAAAREALRSENLVTLPAFPLQRMERARRIGRGLRLAGYIGSMAACVLIGFGLRANSPPDPGIHAPGPTEIVMQTPADAGGFWSARALRERAAKTGAVQQPQRRLIWESPVSLPKIGDAT